MRAVPKGWAFLVLWLWWGPACAEDSDEPDDADAMEEMSSDDGSTSDQGVGSSDDGSQPQIPPPDPVDDAMVEFRITPGTGSGPWNGLESLVVVRVGQVLRIHNDDIVGHTLHTYGMPVEHGEWIQPGEYADHEVITEYDPGVGPPSTYGHEAGEPASFWVMAVPSDP